MSFNPNDIGNTNLNIFGLPFNEKLAQLIFIPAPWDVTVSYQRGTAKGPDAIFDASFQVDLYDVLLNDAWKKGYAFIESNSILKKKNQKLLPHAKQIIEYISEGNDITDSSEHMNFLKSVNTGCAEMVKYIKDKSLDLIDKNKFVAIIGGDHSVPLGLLQALAERNSDFGILHIDAHADLRKAYEGFEFSHASIMYNALKLKSISKLVQLGVRDYCEDEINIISKSKRRIETFFDADIQNKKFTGTSWDSICKNIVDKLPEKVYISFDIDGLDPCLCPNTGTPVPGGIQYAEIIFLLEKLAKSSRKIIGFDLCEVAPGKNEWDANVGARILFKLANCLAYNNKLKNIV